MKFIPLIIFLLIAFGLKSTKNVSYYLSLNPSEIKKSLADLEYKVQLKWQNLDALNGTQFNCNMAVANYTVKPVDGVSIWNDVYLGMLSNFQESSSQSNKLPAFDNWEYKINDTAFLQEQFYQNIPVNQQNLARWLVSDAIQMQGLALFVFDSLKFNKAFIPELLDNYDIKFDNWVTFTSRYQKLIWSGITQFNDEVCAIVKFESLYNPVSAEKKGMKFKGRSLYWGEMWISLEDKQVEFASMIEDVILELDSPAFPQKQLINLQRDIVFEKVQ